MKIAIFGIAKRIIYIKNKILNFEIERLDTEKNVTVINFEKFHLVFPEPCFHRPSR